MHVAVYIFCFISLIILFLFVVVIDDDDGGGAASCSVGDFPTNAVFLLRIVWVHLFYIM